MHAQTLVAALLPAAVMAQYGNAAEAKATSTASAAAASGSSGSSGSSGASSVHVVKVGDGGLTFEPNDIKAAVGDVVEFHFYPKAHSVAQSTFDKPCEPLANGTTVGFFSGPVPVSSGEGSQVYTLKVADTTPKWFYCATGNHCQSGMVGVINAPANGQKTIQQYSAAAAKAQSNVAPASTGGGTLGPAASGSPSSGSGSGSGGSMTMSMSMSATDGGSAATGTASRSGSAASSTASPGAGVEARGDVRWGLLSFGMAVAGVFGGLLV